ncbi:MAG TPA: DUF2975 domain-containing protein [Rudaea sp.]|nr:DUF2975 domain-containing protein [Rudaea sp.]
MSSTSDRALALARPVIQVLTVLNIFYALIVALLLGASFFMEGWPKRPLGIELVTKYPLAPIGLQAIIVLGLLGAAIVHNILRRLLAIVDTVRIGDPFILDNARRLHAIAWSVLAIEVLRLVIVAIASAVWEPGHMGGSSFTPWLSVLLLFVLAGVFAQGARMRADLEGTV